MSPLDIYARAKEIRHGIVEPAFIAELDQEAMAFRAECIRTGRTVAQAAEEIFRSAHEDPDEWAHQDDHGQAVAPFSSARISVYATRV